MIEIDSYDPIIIRMKRIKSDLFIFNRFNILFSVQGSQSIQITFVLIGFNRLFLAEILPFTKIVKHQIPKILLVLLHVYNVVK